MLTPSILLLVAGLLGAFDIVYFHALRAGLAERLASRTEVGIHVARGLVFAVELVVVPSVRFEGAAHALLVALLVSDVLVAMSDVLVEPASRRSQGGLPAGEYFLHMVLASLAGAYLHAVAASTAAWSALPTAIRWAPSAPFSLRCAMLTLAAGAAGSALFDLLGLFAPTPLHALLAARRDARLGADGMGST